MNFIFYKGLYRLVSPPLWRLCCQVTRSIVTSHPVLCIAFIYTILGTYKGRCKCTYGYTGPNGLWITSGVDKKKVYADFCIDSCVSWSRYDRWCADKGIPFSLYH